MLEAEVHRQQRAPVGTGNGDNVPDCGISLVIYLPAHQVKVARSTDTQ